MSATSINNIYQPSKVPAGSTDMQEIRRKDNAIPIQDPRATQEMT